MVDGSGSFICFKVFVRDQTMMGWNPVKFLGSFVGILAILVGLYDIFIKMEENSCDMTYMFDWPEYITIPLDSNLRTKYPKYSLVVYGEGDYAQSLQNKQFYGIPVLFIPGNAGSPKQGRSFASVALQKTEFLSFHFNYFLVDFGDEMSAMKGSYFERQTDFVHECLKIVIDLYKSKENKQDSVLVIAHSMGGIVARGLFTLPYFNPHTVNTMITLATPNSQPVFMFDGHIKAFYSKVNRFWREHSQINISKSALKDLVLVSIGGGHRDFQVRSDLTSMKHLGIHNQTISIVTTAIPKVWVSAEHRCIVWCRQPVLAITRAFIDMVDTYDTRVTDNVSERTKILRYHLEHAHSHRNSIRETILDNAMIMSMNYPNHCKLITKPYFTLFGKSHKVCYLLDIREQDGELVVIYSGKSEDWIHVCKDASSCKTSRSLSTKFQLIPTSNNQLAVFKMKIKDIRTIGNFVRFSAEDSKEEKIFAKVLSDDVITYSISEPSSVFGSSITISQGRIFSRVALPFLRYPWLVHRMNISSQCKKPYAVTAILHIPWFQENTNYTGDKLQDIPLKFYSKKPYGSEDAEIQLWYYTRCSFNIRVWIDLKATSGQLLKYNLEMIFKWVSALSTVFLVYGSLDSPSVPQNSHPHSSYSHSKTNPVPTSLAFTATFLVIKLAVDMAVPEKTIIEVITVFAYQVLVAAGILVVLRNTIWITLCFWKSLFSIASWVTRKIFRGHHKHNKIKGIFILLEVAVQIVASLFLNSSLAILLCLMTMVVKGSTSDINVQHALELGCIILLIRLPLLIVWIKELKYSLKSDNDLFQNSTVGIIIVMFLFCNTRQSPSPMPKLCLLLINLFAWLMTLESVPVYWIPDLICAAILVKCVLTKNFSLKSFYLQFWPKSKDSCAGDLKKDS